MKKTIAILFLTGVVLYGALHPQHAIANDNSIVGSWIVHIFPNPPGPPGPIRNLATFTKQLDAKLLRRCLGKIGDLVERPTSDFQALGRGETTPKNAHEID